ncbi:hypothetical protein ACKC9G_17085 [Pokkaliibacter sp. CJK22405]
MVLASPPPAMQAGFRHDADNRSRNHVALTGVEELPTTLHHLATN